MTAHVVSDPAGDRDIVEGLRLLVVVDDDLDGELIVGMLHRAFPDAAVDLEAEIGAAVGSMRRHGHDCVLVHSTLADDVLAAVAGLASETACVIVGDQIPEAEVDAAFAAGARDWFRMDEIRASALHRSVARAVAHVRSERRARRLAEQLIERDRALVETANEAVRVRDRLLSNVSHELRTPLAAIVQFTSVLAKGYAGEITDEQGEILAAIGRNGDQVARMIDDLLDTFRLDSGLVELDLRVVDASSIVRRAVETVQASAADEGVRLIVLGDDTDHPAVVGDSVRLVQVLVNLLTNSIRYTDPDGTITVSIASSAGEVELVVADTGRGIPDAMLPMIFDRFVQADEDSAGRRGLGVGLHVSKTLVEQMGGSITLDSTFGVGTIVTVRVPVWRLSDAVDTASERWNELSVAAVRLTPDVLRGRQPNVVADTVARRLTDEVGAVRLIMQDGVTGHALVICSSSDADRVRAIVHEALGERAETEVLDLGPADSPLIEGRVKVLHRLFGGA